MIEKKSFSDISYQQFLKEEKLMGSKCKRCGALYAPPRPICIKCHSTEMQWIELKGKGQLVAFTCIAVGPPFMMQEGYDRKHPYVSGVVELEERVKVDARIEEVDGNNPETIRIGTPLVVKFLHRGEGENRQTFLAFRPL
jgi:uncharacterized OB-fold protein